MLAYWMFWQDLQEKKYEAILIPVVKFPCQFLLVHRDVRTQGQIQNNVPAAAIDSCSRTSLLTLESSPFIRRTISLYHPAAANFFFFFFLNMDQKRKTSWVPHELITGSAYPYKLLCASQRYKKGKYRNTVYKRLYALMDLLTTTKQFLHISWCWNHREHQSEALSFSVIKQQKSKAMCRTFQTLRQFKVLYIRHLQYMH